MEQHGCYLMLKMLKHELLAIAITNLIHYQYDYYYYLFSPLISMIHGIILQYWFNLLIEDDWPNYLTLQ